MFPESDRMKFRELTPEDAEAMYLLNADPLVVQYTGDEAFESVNVAQTFLENYSDYSRNGIGRWALIRKSDLQIIGWCGLKLRADGQIDLGYRLYQRFWNHGYATEAAKACLDYGFKVKQFNVIIAEADVRNTASLRVINKLGFTFRASSNNHGAQETHVFEIDRERYLAHSIQA